MTSNFACVISFYSLEMARKKHFKTECSGGEEPIQDLGSAGLLLNTVLPSEERKSQIVFKL